MKTVDDFDPFDFYLEYSEWLVDHYPIGNNHMLIMHLEAASGFESFLEEKGLI